MNRLRLVTILFALLALAGCGADETPAAAPGAATSSEAPFSAYLKALSATSHGETTTDDVDRVLAFYADDIIYEHPGVGIRLEGIEAQRQGLTAFIQSYGGDAETSSIDVIDHMEGPNVAMLRLKVRFLRKDGDNIEPVARDQWRVIETRQGKITRIIDYW